MNYRLEEIFDLQMGKTPSRNNPAYWQSKDNKWISIADLTKSDKYIENTKEYISDKAVEESGISLIPANTVIMSFKLSIGKTAITTEPMYSNEAIMSFRDKHLVDLLPDYIYYLLSGKKWETDTNKAVMGKTLNKATLSNVIVNIDNIYKQKEIVSRLDELNSIIANRKKELQKLDELIKARFVEMFGDPISNEKGWDVVTLNDVCDGIGDGLHGTPEYDIDGTYPFINGNNLVDGSIEITAATKMVNEETYKKHFIEISENAILLSINGTLGKLAFYNGEAVMLGKSACYCNLKSKINREFIYGIMKTDAFKGFLESNSTASTIKNVGLKAIRNFNLILPPDDLQTEYVKFAKQIDKSKFVKINLVICKNIIYYRISWFF
ncbi:MAG: restriction endonuclease subunit S [Spirochaetia bacterium]|nr:restriction endonuclease subunit S [Spirochaetia bacterium]